MFTGSHPTKALPNNGNTFNPNQIILMLSKLFQTIFRICREQNVRKFKVSVCPQLCGSAAGGHLGLERHHGRQIRHRASGRVRRRLQETQGKGAFTLDASARRPTRRAGNYINQS